MSAIAKQNLGSMCYTCFLSNLEQFYSLSLSFMTLKNFLAAQAINFVNYLFIWVCQLFLHNKIQEMAFGRNVTEVILSSSQ